MHKIITAALAAIIALGCAGVSLASTASAAGRNSDVISGCQNKMKAKLGVLSDGVIKNGGDVIVTQCKGLWLTFVTGNSINAHDVFSTQAGFDFFSMNVEFIAETFVEPMPEEYQGGGFPYQAFPNLDAITEEKSDLALGLNGAADTVVFRFTKDSPIMFLKFYESTGAWFTQTSFR